MTFSHLVKTVIFQVLRSEVVYVLDARKQTPVIMANTICCFATANRPTHTAPSTHMTAVIAHATADLLKFITVEKRKKEQQNCNEN